MIAPDANLLLYANEQSSPFHAAARRWLEQILSSTEPVGIPILSIYAFLRLSTNPRLVPKAINFAEAAGVVNAWLKPAHVRVLYPGDRHWQLLQQLSPGLRLSGNFITDAAIAAIALEYGAVVHTHDSDFTRFPGVRSYYPLQQLYSR